MCQWTGDLDSTKVHLKSIIQGNMIIDWGQTGTDTRNTHLLFLLRGFPLLFVRLSSLRSHGILWGLPLPIAGHSAVCQHSSLTLHPVVRPISCTTKDFQSSFTSYTFSSWMGSKPCEVKQCNPGYRVSQLLSYVVKCGPIQASRTSLWPADHMVPLLQ